MTGTQASKAKPTAEVDGRTETASALPFPPDHRSRRRRPGRLGVGQTIRQGDQRCHLPQPPRQPHTWQSSTSSSRFSSRRGVNRPPRRARRLRSFLAIRAGIWKWWRFDWFPANGIVRHGERLSVSYRARATHPCARPRARIDAFAVLTLDHPHVLPLPIEWLYSLAAVLTDVPCHQPAFASPLFPHLGGGESRSALRTMAVKQPAYERSEWGP